VRIRRALRFGVREVIQVRSIIRSTFILWLAAAGARGQAVSTSQISGTIQDSTHLVVPGATITATQTATGFVRTTTSGEDGSYVLPNLPVGPYSLQVTKDGFSAAVQSGIVLQVDTNPVVNFTLKAGSVTEQVVVEASAAMVETHENGVGQVIDQQRIVDLPLNGREATDLIYLSGAATPAPAGDLNTNKNYPTQTISVGGGLANAITYVMDGASNNDPFNNLNLPFPFPDALQEFKVETSAAPAQYGQHGAATVNVVTKSGTNELHGDLFEFLRNGDLNARDFFATSRDSLKRNQFGGTLGGPVVKNKMFFFAGYQGTVTRSDPPSTVSYVPTQAMLNGNFGPVTSPACNGGRQITLSSKYGFVNNTISPALFNPQALNILKHIPVSTDPCGKLVYGIINDSREHQIVGRIDDNLSARHQIYGRYFIANYNNPTPSVPSNILEDNKTAVADQSQSFALGDNYIFSPTTLAAFHGTVNRTRNLRTLPPYFSPADVGIQVASSIPGYMGLSVSGNGFSIGAGATNPGYFNSTDFQLAEDVSLIRGSHQISLGVNWIHAIMNTVNNRPTNGAFTFNGQDTGLSLADFMVGAVSGGFLQGNPDLDNDRANFIGAYAQDSWKLNRRLTVNLGLRWEPFIPEHNVNGFVEHFDPALFAAGKTSAQYVNSPPGLIYPGDPGFPGRSNTNAKMADFAPRVGLVWDPAGNGLMTIRASYGLFYDTPQLFFFTRFSNSPPWGAQINIPDPAGGLTNPWLGYPGGNPFPALNNVNKNMPFPLEGVYVNMPLNTNPPYLQQWNLSLQRQVGANLLLSATYLGNETTHLWTGREMDPAIYVPGATLSSENQHRVLYLQNPAYGQYYSTIGQLDDGGTASYNAMLITAQHRLSSHFTVLGNYTRAHCISAPETTELTGPTYVNPNNRNQDRANCDSDRRNIVNLSAIATSPHIGRGLLDHIAANWQLSAIVRYQSGNYSTVTIGVDTALSGIGGQRPNLAASDVFAPNPTPTRYLLRSAFTTPATGTLGNLGPLNILNPSMLQIDMGLVRNFPVAERQTLQFRWEVFNVPNLVNFSPPVTGLNAGSFGQILSDITASVGQSAGDPRIMQFALKYMF